jgi:hypothetical protein
MDKEKQPIIDNEDSSSATGTVEKKEQKFLSDDLITNTSNTSISLRDVLDG